MKEKDFILSDETVNSHGLIIKTAGINLKRFIKNPIMGNQHLTDISNVIGKWNNIRLDGNKLIANAEFDMEDPKAELIAGKVERGFINSVSIGLDVLSLEMPEDINNPIVVTESEIYEASIVSIPSNSNAVKLKYKNKELLLNDDITNENVKLFLSADNEITIKNKEQIMTKKVEDKFKDLKLEMDVKTDLDLIAKLVESNETLKLSLTEKDSMIETKNSEMVSLTDSNLELNKVIDGYKEAETLNLIDNAIADGKFDKGQKDSLVELSKSNLDALKTLIDNAAVKPAVKLSTKIDETDSTDPKSKWSFSDYQSNDPEGLKLMKKENQEKYLELYNKEYKK